MTLISRTVWNCSRNPSNLLIIGRSTSPADVIFKLYMFGVLSRDVLPLFSECKRCTDPREIISWHDFISFFFTAAPPFLQLCSLPDDWHEEVNARRWGRWRGSLSNSRLVKCTGYKDLPLLQLPSTLLLPMMHQCISCRNQWGRTKQLLICNLP